MSGKMKNISGQRFGKLIAIKPTGDKKIIITYGYVNVIVEKQ